MDEDSERPDPALPAVYEVQLQNQVTEEVVGRTLEHARAYINHGDPLKALETVLQLLSALQLPNDLQAAANRVRDAMLFSPAAPEPTTATSELVSLLGQLSLGIQPSHQPHQADTQPAGLPPSTTSSSSPWRELHGLRIDPRATSDHRLAELRLSSAEGESYTCLQCRGIVSVARRETHQRFWCSALNHTDGNNHSNNRDNVAATLEGRVGSHTMDMES